MEGISITKLLIIAALIILLFGTNKLRSLGSDLGSAIKGFKKAMKEDENTPPIARSDEDKSHAAEKVSHKE